MRFWCPYLFGALPDKLLASLHRDVCRVRVMGGSNNDIVKGLSLSVSSIFWYHRKVMAEMSIRGWKYNVKWNTVQYRGKKAKPYPKWVNEGQEYDLDVVYWHSITPEYIAEETLAITQWRQNLTQRKKNGLV